jgi:hypothetical protein
MRYQTWHLASGLTAASLRRPRLTLVITLVVIAACAWQMHQLRKEVGYAAFFGPDAPGVVRLADFLEEFDSGLHVVIAFGCQRPDVCVTATELRILELLGRLQRDVERLPNVRRTRSLLDTPIVVGPLETRTVATRTPDGRFQLADDWQALVARAPTERFVAGSVISPDVRTLGLVVEFQSLASQPLRDLVHGILALLPKYEAELGGDLFVAGDPVWSVALNDDLDRDSNILSALMIVVMLLLLYGLFRDIRLAVLPVVAIALLVVSIQGLIAIFSIPMTTIMAALPPLLVVIATASTMHLVAAYLRSSAPDPSSALISAAREVGTGCFWATVTTVAGFGSFVLSDLPVFQHFGIMAALGVAVAYLVTFGTIPPLLVVFGGRRGLESRSHQPVVVLDLLRASRDAVLSRPLFVLCASLVTMLLLTTGIQHLRYEADFGFGDQHFVMRSVRFIENNFRKPMTTELVVTIPEGSRIYDETSLRLLERLERYFDDEPSTGHVWSLLDYLEEAYRLDRGAPPPSLDELVRSAPVQMPLVAGFDGVSRSWSEETIRSSNGPPRARDRARVSVDRAWLDDSQQAPYLRRLRGFVADLNQELAPRGYRVEIEGPHVLADLFVERIRDTQWRSFGFAFLVVAATFFVVLRGSPRLASWAIAVNVLPVASLLGLMGWVGVGVDPANAMVGAILLALAVDDTIHMTLRLRLERDRQPDLRRSFVATLDAVGVPIVISSVCLSLGFAVLMFSRWGGLMSFGLLASLGIVIALAADLMLMPAGLLCAERRTSEELESDAAG